MTGSVDELLACLDLEPLADNLFRGQSIQTGWFRVFGGQVLGQALVAASRTVEASRPAHSLHAYFILGGDPAAPIDYAVERIRDGRSFATRRVLAHQHGRAIFTLSASFHIEEDGALHQAGMPDVPPPEALLDAPALAAAAGPAIPATMRAYLGRATPIELRPVEVERYLSRDPREPRFHVWMRARERLPDEPALHRAVLAYASDLMLLDATLIPHGKTVFDASIQSASLDHALWFHRSFRADDWLLYVHDSPSASGARGFARGSLFTRRGELVASVAQEGLIRPTGDGS
ncbi:MULTISPECIES: acyl-CoA thioesterase II [unclassified Methylobacterium]|uniref:acyl-CoA thioesterase II n=1 Tax=unclassified Methylobacterium TaxID=2615210 RepID=UPI0006F7020E|nr:MULTISPECIES: acyl-CoA thioesterase II [unclassified Methylobacterium]KQO54280.1 acyl-CoA thioesterase II [Methylobacterium sp. Leaf86]KQO90255.1 acyl-CoA thioesterase II [Methylobacterium sp. Leaf91]